MIGSLCGVHSVVRTAGSLACFPVFPKVSLPQMVSPQKKSSTLSSLVVVHAQPYHTSSWVRKEAHVCALGCAQ